MVTAASRRLAVALTRALALALMCLALPAAQAQRVSTGTGFFVTADGYFVTCFHVIVGSESVSLRNLKGEVFAARVVLTDRSSDLALLKAEGRFRPLPVGTSVGVRRGAAIVTMGFPNVNLQGIEPKVTDGILNSFSGANNDPRVFQFSAPIQTGNSGGPLVSMEGNVIGIVASKLDAQAIARQTGDIPQNVNYAIKSQYLKDLLERAAAQEPRIRAGLAEPLSGEKTRVVDVVPALEEAIALVIARAPSGTAAVPAEARERGTAPADERRGRVAAEYRKLQGELNRLSIDQLSLINQANTLKLMLQFEPGAGNEQRQADLAAVTRRLEALGTRRAETIRRMNELAAEYRQLQAEAKGST